MEAYMTTQTIEKELLELEKKYWQAVKDNDVATATSLTADPCIVAGATGVALVPREKLSEIMKSATYKLKSFELKDVQTLMVKDNVAILAYKVHEELTVDEKPVTLEAADASTWVRRDGRWLCTLHTEAVQGDPYGRDRGQQK
jgi:ketosteroid isomerase-like protein